MKIHIIGGSGSGKTYLARHLSEQYNIPHFDLDDIQWDNQAQTYGIPNTKKKRAELLKTLLQNDKWIIEGVYYAWCGQCFKEADKIIVLETKLAVCKWRVIRRFIRRKLGKEHGKKETLTSLKNLLKWMTKYNRIDIPQINQLLTCYSQKTEHRH